MQPNERVILIKGDAGQWYNQAIFIVNKDISPNKMPVDFVAEAEKIIFNYIHKKDKPSVAVAVPKPVVPKSAPPKQRPAKMTNKGFDLMLNIVMLAGCAVIAGILLFGFVH